MSSLGEKVERTNSGFRAASGRSVGLECFAYGGQHMYSGTDPHTRRRPAGRIGEYRTDLCQRRTATSQEDGGSARVVRQGRKTPPRSPRTYAAAVGSHRSCRWFLR